MSVMALQNITVFKEKKYIYSLLNLSFTVYFIPFFFFEWKHVFSVSGRTV